VCTVTSFVPLAWAFLVSVVMSSPRVEPPRRWPWLGAVPACPRLEERNPTTSRLENGDPSVGAASIAISVCKQTAEQRRGGERE
jgi:hypothetical protein